MKRSLLIKHNDDSKDIELELGKAVLIDTSSADFIYIEKMNDGKWRLTATKSVIEDFSKIESFDFIREE